MLPPYAELHCVSNFSFLRGASHPEELVERARTAGYAALALTDECSLAGVVRAHLAAREAGLKLIIGSEIILSDDDMFCGTRVVLLATNRNGYGNLAELISLARRRAEKGRYRLTPADLAAGLDDCLALLAPGALDNAADAERGLAALRWLEARFPGRCWLAVELHRGTHDRMRLARLRRMARAAGVPAVAAGDVHMHVRARRRLQDVLTATRLRTTLEHAGTRLFPNAERHLRSRAVLAGLYPHELMAETLNVAARCTFSLDELRYEYPAEIVPPGHSPTSWLRQLTAQGFCWRFGEALDTGAPCPGGAGRRHNPVLGHREADIAAARQRVEHELALIAELAYEPYFLTVQDIVAWARKQRILCQGRGSAANSAVCYCLGITEVDPSRMDMLFERFISKERNEPPDIDVDFEHERREEVIQYIYAKYGRERAALAAALITYRPRSALKDVGRALGFDPERLNELTRNLGWWERGNKLPERMREAGFDPDEPLTALLIELARALIGFPRHLSQHTGGFVIARDRLSRLVPIENAAMPDRTVIEWDKDDLDALGLLKIDVLALGMLTAIRKALDCVSAWRGTQLDMADIPPEDAAVYDMLCEGDSVGVFQVESRAQMSMLPRLAPRRFYDLVIEVAIVRPGPIQGGMVHPYLRRRQKLEPVTYPSPQVESVLDRTLGVPIFQEQVMQLSIVAAGFTPGEADQLRRAMAAWRRKGGLEPFEKKLVEGMRARGYSEDFARQVFQQILGFGEYGFPESHAASFALLVYVSCWLKRHEPAAFLCGLLNAQPMGFYAPSQLIQDAQRHGVIVLPVDATVSVWDCVQERLPGHPSPACRLGLRMVSGLPQDAAARLLAARAARPFEHVDALARRAALDAREMRLLAQAGALARLAGHRRQAVWAAAGSQPAPDVLRRAGIDESRIDFAPPNEAAEIVADFSSLGFTLGRHPLSLLRTMLAGQRFVRAQEINAASHRQLARAAGVVTCRQRPGTASGVVFVTLEDETGNVNVIVHADLVERQRRALIGSRLMGVYGQVQREGKVVHLIAKRLVDLSHLLGALDTRSRDFH